MTLSNVELYEALKPSIGEEAARLMAEVYPAARDLATRSDLLEVQGELRDKIVEVQRDLGDRIAGLQAETLEQHGDLKALVAQNEVKIEASGRSIMRWMLGLFVPMWATTVVALLVALSKV